MVPVSVPENGSGSGFCSALLVQGPLNGGVSNGGVSRSGLVLPFLSFFVLFRTFPIFPGFSRFARMVRGFSRFISFPSLALLRAATRNSPERVRDTIWTFPEKSGKPPGLETPRFSFSQLVHRIAAFAFAFAMAIPRCQWRHRCVVTLGKFLVVLYSKPLWRKGKWKQRRKGDVRDVKYYHGRC